MPREITLTEEEFNGLHADLQSAKLTGDDKVIGQMIYDRAQKERAGAKRNDAGWYFRWTYYF